MSKPKTWIARVSALVVMAAICAAAIASVQDATIVIDHALNSPTLTIRYNGAHVAMVELRLNGASYATRSADATSPKGETDFTLDIASLANGDNEVEVRLYDKSGKLIGAQESTIVSDDGQKAPVYLQEPKIGATVQGPVQITLGFGKDLKNVYVSFFVDNQFKAMSNTPPFNYVWDTGRDSNGWHDLEAWVVDDASNTYKTRKVKVYVNNPGGLTVRQFTPITTPTPPPSAVAVARVPVSVVKAPIAVVKAPVSATPKPKLGLKLSEPVPSTHLSNVAHGAKNAGVVAVLATTKSARAIPPTVSAHFAKPALTSPIRNSIVATIGAFAGIKPAKIGSPVSSGPRILLPTGKRLATEGKPVLSGPIGPLHAHGVKSAPTPQPSLSPLPKVIATPSVPAKPSARVKALDPAISIIVVHPKSTIKTADSVSPDMATGPNLALQPGTPVAPKHAALKVMRAPVVTITKVKAAISATKLIAVGHGTKLPNASEFEVSLNARPVQFDSVKPRVSNNVPLTPFRYLFEQNGGKVYWTNRTKTVTANGQGKDVYIRIGDKLAKVNNLPVELDLSPFIENGRTIVPLSFIKDALDVEVEYDPTTNHVLITSIKKKH